MPPSRPLAPPVLVSLQDRPMSMFRAGAYSINLTTAMPALTPRAPPPPLVGFLFKVEDRDSHNVTFLWQVNAGTAKVSHYVVCAWSMIMNGWALVY